MQLLQNDGNISYSPDMLQPLKDQELAYIPIEITIVIYQIQIILSIITAIFYPLSEWLARYCGDVALWSNLISASDFRI